MTGQIADPVGMHKLRSMYVQAGIGLIKCNRGNLAALSDIVFVPAAMQDLAPFLDESIREAGGTPPKREGLDVQN